MKKVLFIAIISAIIIPCSLFSSCGDDEAENKDIIENPEENKTDSLSHEDAVDSLLDTSVSPDFCHAILITESDEEKTYAIIREDTLKFNRMIFPTSDLQDLSVSPGDSIDVRILSARRYEYWLKGIWYPEDAQKRVCRVALCE